MYGAIFALVIALMMIGFVIYKSRSCGVNTYICRKSEMADLIAGIPDDCIIQIWIGRNTYEEFRDRNSPRRNLRDNISERG